MPDNIESREFSALFVPVKWNVSENPVAYNQFKAIKMCDRMISQFYVSYAYEAILSNSMLLGIIAIAKIVAGSDKTTGELADLSHPWFVGGGGCFRLSLEHKHPVKKQNNEESIFGELNPWGFG